jgi:hypothetical protein
MFQQGPLRKHYPRLFPYRVPTTGTLLAHGYAEATPEDHVSKSQRYHKSATMTPSRPVKEISPEAAEKLRRLRMMLDLGLITHKDYEDQIVRIENS